MLTPERQIQSNGSTVLYSLSCDCAIPVSVLWNTPPEHRSLMHVVRQLKKTRSFAHAADDDVMLLMLTQMLMMTLVMVVMMITTMMTMMMMTQKMMLIMTALWLML